jgi:hypothetical protein
MGKQKKVGIQEKMEIKTGEKRGEIRKKGVKMGITSRNGSREVKDKKGEAKRGPEKGNS